MSNQEDKAMVQFWGLVCSFVVGILLWNVNGGWWWLWVPAAAAILYGFTRAHGKEDNWGVYFLGAFFVGMLFTQRWGVAFVFGFLGFFLVGGAIDDIGKRARGGLYGSGESESRRSEADAGYQQQASQRTLTEGQDATRQAEAVATDEREADSEGIQNLIRIVDQPSESVRTPPRVVCPYCQTSFGSGKRTRTCPECEVKHHVECWNANGGCTTFGCGHSPQNF